LLGARRERSATFRLRRTRRIPTLGWQYLRGALRCLLLLVRLLRLRRRLLMLLLRFLLLLLLLSLLLLLLRLGFHRSGTRGRLQPRIVLEADAVIVNDKIPSARVCSAQKIGQ
jgi:hypothetical protein